MSAQVVNAKTTLFCGGLPIETIDESIIENLFIPFGDIIKIQMPLDMETGKPKGYAFIEYENQEDCKAAIDNMNLSELEGKFLKVNLARYFVNQLLKS